MKNQKITDISQDSVSKRGRHAKNPQTTKENLLAQERLAREMRLAIANSGLKIGEFFKKYDIPVHVGTAIAKNSRWFGHSDKDLIKKIAKAINYPVLWVYLWTNVLSIDDFVFEENLESVLESAYLVMRVTPKSNAFMIPSDEVWQNLSTEAKLSMVLLYQEAFKNTVLKLATIPVPA